MADNQVSEGATPTTPDPADGATPGGQEPTEGATPAAGSREGAKPDTSLGGAGREALDKERNARREADRQLAEARNRVAELEDRDKSETERAKAELQRSQDRIKELEADQRERELLDLKREVAAEAELPPQMAQRLQGTDLRSLRADARTLKEAVNAGRPVGDLGIGRGGAATATDAGRDMNQRIREAAGR